MRFEVEADGNGITIIDREGELDCSCVDIPWADVEELMDEIEEAAEEFKVVTKP